MNKVMIITALLTIDFTLPVHAEPQDFKLYTIEQFFDTVAVRGASFSSDGSKVLVSTDETGVLNAFALPVNGGPREQLTHSTTDAIYTRSYFPRDDRFIYQSDQGGNELTHVYVQETDGKVVDITPGKGLKASFHSWAQDDTSFFITSNERDPNFFDLYEVSADHYERKMIYQNDAGHMIAGVSPDKNSIALRHIDTRANSNVFIHDRKTGETSSLMTHEDDAVRDPGAFTKNGDAILCLTDIDHEFQYLVQEGLDGKSRKVLEKLDWDVRSASLSKKGKYRVVVVNNDSVYEARLYETATGSRVPLPRIEDTGIASLTFSRDEDAIAFYVQGARTPGDIYYYRLDGSAPPKRLTRRLSEQIDARHLVSPKVVRFESYDGVTVPGILYKPNHASTANKVPALIYVHGGPGGQTRAIYSPSIQYLVNHGYAVYGINNRGSSGYGKSFFALDDLKHGSADLDDCVHSKQMLMDTGYVDPERIGIMGRSYGGYMVCAALAFRPQEFEVGVDIFGVTNWVRTLKSTPKWWTARRNALYKELGDPFEQEDYLRSISPLFHAKNIVRPMIVLQGANDPRVLQVESDEMVAAVRANGVPVEYIVFPDEGHGFRKKENRITGYRAVLEFLEEHLKNPTTP